jgi:hypothetical protein
MTHRLRATITTTLLSLALAACGGKGGATTPAGGGAIGDDPVTEMERVKDAMCACETTDCVNEVGERLNAVGATFAGSKLTAEQSDRVTAASTAIDECAARITGAPDDERRSPPNI